MGGGGRSHCNFHLVFRNTVEDSGQMTVLSVLRNPNEYRLPSNQKAPHIQSSECL